MLVVSVVLVPFVPLVLSLHVDFGCVISLFSPLVLCYSDFYGNERVLDPAGRLRIIQLKSRGKGVHP
jgi:hypothetical protein